jgi:hypothetical protein
MIKYEDRPITYLRYIKGHREIKLNEVKGTYKIIDNKSNELDNITIVNKQQAIDMFTDYTQQLERKEKI